MANVSGMNLAGVKTWVVRHGVLQRPLRFVTSKRTAEPGTTVVIVNWNTARYLEVSLEMVTRRSPPDTRVIVVDNGSTDRSRAVARAADGVRLVRLPINVGHELAMDLGFLLARTEYVVALDVDAFPLADDWLYRLLQPLRTGAADVSGAHVRGGFVHPCCLAMRTSRFRERRHTFTARRADGLASDADATEIIGWDTGLSISIREKRRQLFERTRVFGPGDTGSIWDGLIYHNFYSSRFGSKLPPMPEELRLGVTERAAEAAWTRALEEFA